MRTVDEDYTGRMSEELDGHGEENATMLETDHFEVYKIMFF